MKSKLTKSKFSILGVLLFFWIHPLQATSVDLVFGYNYGYSKALTEKQYDVYIWNSETGDKVFTIPRLNNCQTFYAQIFSKNNKFGLGFEVLKQNYIGFLLTRTKSLTLI